VVAPSDQGRHGGTTPTAFITHLGLLYIDLDRQDYDELHRQAIAMMENFRTEVENSAISGKYRRENSDYPFGR
jgi:creatinine amidohydrolase/Fe(II)-dependent formamide hydrolase-like protein